MTKKTISSTQVRLEPEMAKEMNRLRGLYEAKISLSAFVNLMLKRSVESSLVRTIQVPTGDTGESSFKK